MGVTLETVDGRLAMRSDGDAPGSGVAIDLGTIDVRSLGGHPLVRAVGRGVGTVVDATAGLGGDAWILAASGRSVVAIERHALMHALLDDALAHARSTPALAHVAARITLMHADARHALAEAARGAWSILVDPMFPPKSKSALAPRDIRLVKEAVGDDPDAAELLAAALATTAARIIVKRPHEAPPLGGPAHHVIESRLVRYDIYDRPHLMPRP
ncbi:MAG: rRNA methyltransferase [Phycisphaerae bacterium]|nr:rRNA methyltransferase [Phycisphaerae bacterium]